MKQIYMLAALAALSACASPGRPPAMGGEGQGAGQGAVLSGDALLWVSFDADRDYITSRAEAAAGLDEEWTRAGGVALSPLDFEAWARRALAGPDLAPFRLEFDRNMDNQITREEFDAALMARFSEHDRDGDGQLRRGELVQQVARMPMQGGDGPRGGGGPPRGRGRPPG